MEEVKRSKSNVHSKQKIPVYPNGRSSSLRPANSNVSLSPLQGGSFLGSGMTSSSTALNNSLAQGVISAQIGSQAQELLKIRELGPGESDEGTENQALEIDENGTFLLKRFTKGVTGGKKTKKMDEIAEENSDEDSSLEQDYFDEEEEEKGNKTKSIDEDLQEEEDI